MTEPAESVPMLPGIADALSSVRPVSGIERAARDQIGALHDAGRLTADHQLLVALILELAATIGASRGKAAGVAMAARQLQDAIEKLPALVEDDQSGEWAQVVELLGGPRADD